jgi:NTP pyrophosphatase (non-canonical NTP hydrolase)
MNYEHHGMLINGVLGLCGESGEVADIVKKATFQGHELDVAHIAKELGDVAWYLAVAANSIGYDLETIMQMNIDKLKKRYPEGFDSERSQHREKGDI